MSKQAKKMRLALHIHAYQALLAQGLTPEQALAHMQYLHPIALACLKKAINAPVSESSAS